MTITAHTKQYLVGALDGAPLILGALWQGVSPDWYDVTVEHDRFTLRQALAHIADWEEVFLVRLKQLISETNPTLVGIDEGQRSIDRKYEEIDPAESIVRYTEGRRHLADLVRNLSDEDWSRPGMHSYYGNSSVLDVVVLITCHDAYHFRQIVEFKNELAATGSGRQNGSNVITAPARIELLRRAIPGSGGLEAALYLLALPPGGEAPVHKHPGIGVGYVLEGVYESQYEGEDLKKFTAGDPIYDLAETPHLIARNGSADESLRFVMAFVVDKGGATSAPIS